MIFFFIDPKISFSKLYKKKNYHYYFLTNCFFSNKQTSDKKFIKRVRMTHTLSLCVCSNIRWRLRALTEFPYDLRRISHSLCNNKQSLKLPSLRWNFQTKQTGRFGRRGLYLLFTKALRPPSPSLSKFPVTRARICTTYTSVWNTCDNTAPIHSTTISRPLISLPPPPFSICLSLFTDNQRWGYSVWVCPLKVQ